MRAYAQAHLLKVGGTEAQTNEKDHRHTHARLTNTAFQDSSEPVPYLHRNLTAPPLLPTHTLPRAGGSLQGLLGGAWACGSNLATLAPLLTEVEHVRRPDNCVVAALYLDSRDPVQVTGLVWQLRLPTEQGHFM